ncbi:MAG: metal ABC transporter ATP-binding protein [Endomicrobiaceae bacterium]|nr:metal ABC transporter ATP-binding protein [Endomicrobiaceae bacterium]
MNTAVLLSDINLIANNSRYILQNINLEFNYGDCVAIIGPNGAGKSTLLKIINALIKPTSGKIKIFEEDISNKIKNKIGYIPQSNYFDPFLPISVKEVISIGLSAKYGILKKLSYNDSQLIEDIAKNVGIIDLINTPIGKLSGGEAQKLSIARVLAQDAKLILMDEPLSNLDNKAQKDILNTIDFVYQQQTVTILIVLHNLSQIPKSCNKLLFISNGQIVKFGKKEDIFNNKQFQELYNL